MRHSHISIKHRACPVTLFHPSSALPHDCIIQAGNMQLSRDETSSCVHFSAWLCVNTLQMVPGCLLTACQACCTCGLVLRHKTRLGGSSSLSSPLVASSKVSPSKLLLGCVGLRQFILSSNRFYFTFVFNLYFYTGNMSILS